MGALALEVMWTRAISVAAGTSTYSFTVMLAAFLVGIALGSCLHALVPLRRVDEAVQLGALLLLIGATSWITTQAIPHLPQLSVDLNARLYGGIAGVGGYSTLLLSFVVMLVPCALLGMAFPVAGQARARLLERFGQSVGDLVGMNTVGCVAGALLAGFVLVPRFGLQRSMLLAAAALAGYGLVVLAVAAVARYPRMRLATVSLALLAIGAAGYAALAAPAWDARLLGAFCNNLMAAYRVHGGEGGFENVVQRLHLIYYHEGAASIVSVIDNAGTRSFVVMGKAEASDSHSDLQHERLLGHLPVLMHAAPRSAAVVGLGAGITLGGVAAHEELERITLIEIEPGVRGIARVFADINDNALDDPRLEVVFQDGRNYLLTTREKFDVITADPIHPWAAGSSYLYTVDYYRVAASRLAEGGIMCQWLPLYELSEANLRSAVATFNAAFPHVTVWQTALDAVLIGSNRALRIDPQELERRLSAPRVAAQLEPIGLSSAPSFLTELVLDEAASRRFGEGAVINTDDNLYLEFSAPLSIGTPRMYDNVRLLDSLRTSPRELLTGLLPQFDSEEVQAATLADYMRTKSETVLAQLELRGAGADTQARVARHVRERLLAALAKTPDHGRGRSLLALACLGVARDELQAGRKEQALIALHEAAAADPFNPDVAHELANTLHAAGHVEAALAEFERARQLRPRNANILLDYGVALLDGGRTADAVEQFRSAVGERPASAEAHHALGFALARAGQFDTALGEFAQARRLDPTLLDAYNNTFRVLMHTERHREAWQTLHDGLRVAPDDPTLLSNLVRFHLSVPEDELRDPHEALRMAERLTGSGSSAMGPSGAAAALELLAAAQAAAGDVRQGLETARRALSAAQATGDAARAASLEQRVRALEQQQATAP
jgi:spermidine synthase/Flp pilus assembly protein TadD